MRILAGYKDLAWIPCPEGGQAYKLKEDGSLSSRPSRKYGHEFFRGGIYWPASLEELHALHETHAGLTLCKGSPPRNMMDYQREHCFLVLENHKVYTHPEWGDPYHRNTKRTAPGVYFGYTFRDGGKWGRAPEIRAQFCSDVLVPSDWLGALKDRYGFDHGFNGSISLP